MDLVLFKLQQEPKLLLLCKTHPSDQLKAGAGTVNS